MILGNQINYGVMTNDKGGTKRRCTSGDVRRRNKGIEEELELAIAL